MPTPKSLETLAQHRDALLLAEVAAWLHMFGKFQEEFLKGNHALDIEIPQLVKDEFPQFYAFLTDKWTGQIWASLPTIEFTAQDLSISSFIEKHRENSNSEGLLKLMWDAHGRGSGIEKGVLDRFAPSQSGNVYLSTAFGYESLKQISITESDQKNLYAFLETQLLDLKQKKQPIEKTEWLAFRVKFIDTIENSFRTSIGDSRRPLNDVSIYDQTALSVAFLKAALAQNLLTGWQDPSVSVVKDKYHWRLLRIGLDGLAFWGSSARMADLLARKQLVATALDKVKELLEVTYPLGFEIYRDEMASIFIMPEIADLLDYSTGGTENRKLLDCIQLIAQKSFSGETNFAIQPLSDGTRNTLSFGKIAATPIAKPSPNADWLAEQWPPGTERQICYVCGLRPWGEKGSKAFDRKVCKVCEERRTDRVRKWLREPKTTIWIDEVADKTGRIALVAAQFEVENWIAGTNFNTVMAFDPQTRPLPNVTPLFELKTLLSDIQNGLKPKTNFKNDSLLGKLVKSDSRGKKLDRGNEVLNTVEDFYDFQLQDTDLAETLPTNTKKAELLVLALLRQNPSFARIRRVWETTRHFWDEIQADFAASVGLVGPRLSIKGQFTEDAQSLGIYHAYELKLGSLRFSVVCIAKSGAELEFISAENLERAASQLATPKEIKEKGGAAEFLRDQLSQGKSFDIEEPTGYGSPNKLRGKLAINAVDAVEIVQHNYLPVIPILAEPRTFMVLVPADKSLEVVKAIQKKYECEMSKVRNRLPLTVGVVYAGARTPLPAILDAGRRLLKQPTQPQTWQVTCLEKLKLDATGWPSKVKLILCCPQNSEKQLVLEEITTVMGDKATKDVWYPYWKVSNFVTSEPFDSRERRFEKPVDADPQHNEKWVHICDLKAGDTVELQPSRFDFEWLDTASRRFEISYKDSKRRVPGGGDWKPRPYYLEQVSDLETLWGILEKSLSTSQIKALVTLIETKRADWSQDSSELKVLIKDAVKNLQWQKDKAGQSKKPTGEDLHLLEQAAISGQLADVAELYMEILKRKPQADLDK